MIYPEITPQSVIHHFISKYEKQNKHADNANWSPYQCKAFIKLAFVVHKNPKIKNDSENEHVTTMQHAGNVGSTQTDLDMIFGNPDKHSLPNFTLIEGAPGIGKTVVAKEIAYRWAQKTMLLNIELLLLISFRETNITQVTSFQELIQHCYGDDKKAATECAKHLINTQGKNLMIIFDGYDEITTEQKGKTDSIFNKLLSRNSVPKCNLVVTSRPKFTVDLHQQCDCRIEIMGFTKKDRHSYFKENLSLEQFDIVTKFLKEHLIIDSLCYIPLNLMSFLKLVEHTSNIDKLPKTQTKLTEHTVRLTIARNKEKKEKFVENPSTFQDEKINEIIESLASLAYIMLDKEKIVFSESELRRAGIYTNDDDDKYGLLKAVQLKDIENVGDKKVYNFVHFSVQEYLAAKYLSKMYTIAQSFAINHKFWDDKYYGVWRMYVGLTEGDNLPLKQFLSGEWFIIAGLRHYIGLDFPGISENFKANKVICLRLYQIFLEAPDSKIKESLSTVVKSDTLDLSEEKFDLADMSMLSYFITRSYVAQLWQMINLSNCEIDDNGLQAFNHGLCIEDGREKPKIMTLEISQNHISKLRTIIDLITKCNLIVNLKASEIFKDKFIERAQDKFYKYFNETLQTLDLSNNHFQAKDIKDLCNALVKCKNLKLVDLNNNKIGDYGIRFLAKTIVQLDKLELLAIKNNAFSNNESTERLFEFITTHHLTFSTQNEKSLDFKNCTENIHNFISLLGYAKNVSSKNSKYINCVSHLNKLSLECTASIPDISPKNADFPLEICKEDDIYLTRNASIFFQKHFRCLKEINLSGLVINEDSAEVILFGSKLQCLQMNNCKLTSNATKLIAGKLKVAINLEELHLCNNCIGNETTEALAVAFLHSNSFKRFEFEGNCFSNKNVLLFKFLLFYLKSPNLSLKYFKLSGDLNAISCFITLLGYMKQVPTYKSWYVKNVSEIIELDLDHQTTGTSLELTVSSSDGFQIFNHLESLNISGMIIREDAAYSFAKVLHDNVYLKKLFMNKCQITSPILKIICQQLKCNSSLKVFEMSENFVDDDTIEDLAKAILHWDSLECLRMDKNQFSTEGVMLLRMLKEDTKPDLTVDFKDFYVLKSFIDILDYVNNKTGKRIIQFLTNLSKVAGLYLRAQTHIELTFNASISFKNIRNLTLLNFTGIIISENISNNFCELLAKNYRSLKKLIMNNCGLTSSTVSRLVDKLKLAATITDAQFCKNKIDDGATKPLVIAILHWNMLKTFQIDNNLFTNLSDQIFDVLREYLKFSGACIDLNGDVDKITAFITLLNYMVDVDIHSSIVVENVSKIQKLLLDCSEHATVVKFEVHASQFFTRFVNLTHLNISGINISKQVANNLARSFDINLCTLEHLIMNNCQLTSVKVIDVIKRLVKCIKLRELQLCNNLVDDEAARDLVLSILHLNTLEILKLEQNRFSKIHKNMFYFLMNNLQFCALKIDLNDVDSIKAFIALLEYMTIVSIDVSRFVDNISSIEILKLDCSKQNTEEEALEFTFKASEFFPRFKLTKLNLSGMPITKVVVDNLCKAFGSDLLFLEYLLMNECSLSSETVNLFMCKLQNAKNIKEIEMCNNSIDDKATKSLVMAILKWNLLECIKLENNYFTETSTILFKILKEFLRFSNNFIDYDNRLDKIVSFITLLSYMVDVDFCHSVIVDNISKINKLLLDCSDQKTIVVFEVHASQFFTRFVNLTHLNISGIVIRKEVASNFAKALDINLCLLQHLIMNKCQLTSLEVCDIIKRLHKCVDLTELQLCNNFIDDESTEPLIIAIICCKKFESLKFEGNKFSKKNILLFEFLLSNLRFCDLSLDLSNDLGTSSSFISLLGYIKGVSTDKSCYIDNVSKVRKLDLSSLDHKVTDTPLKWTVSSSEGFQIFNHLESLNISGMIIREDSACSFAKFLHDNVYLKKLFMNKCQITSPILKIICQQLKYNSSLKVFEMSENFVDDDTIEDLAKAILHWDSLECLRMDKNQFSTEGVMLLRMLKEDTKPDLTVDFKDFYVLKSFIDILDYVNNKTGKRIIQFLTNLSKVAGLYLRAQTHIELTFNASISFKNIRNLTLLNFTGIIISENISNNFCELLAKNYRSLKKLIMNNCGLTSSTVSRLVDKLKLAATITDAQFCKNKIDDGATKPLVIAILHWNMLKTFQIDNNLFTNLSDQIFDVLREYLKFSGACIDLNGDVDKITAFITLLNYMVDVDIHSSIVVENVSKIQKLLLDCSEHATVVKFEVHASQFFTRFVNLTHLNISGINISKQVANNLARSFDINLCTLEHLIMNNCQLTSVKVIDVIKRLVKCIKLRELQLCNNLVDDEAARDLVLSILHLNTLEILKLEQNHFSKIHKNMFYFLMNNLQFCALKIDLNDVDSIKAFIALLEYMTIVSIDVSRFVDNISITKNLSLNCSKQNIEDKALELTFKASEFFPRFTLTTLNLSGIQITEVIVHNLIKSFGSDLEYLLLNECNLNSETVIIFMQKLQKNCNNIKELHLCKNNIDDEVTEALAIAVLHWNSLIVLNLEDTQLSEQSLLLFKLLIKSFRPQSIIFSSTYTVKSFLSVLNYASFSDGRKSLQFKRNVAEITTLSLKNNPNQPVLALPTQASCFFQIFSSLKIFSISGIFIGQQAGKKLCEVFGKNLQSLQHLTLNGCCLTTDIFKSFLVCLKNAPIEKLEWCNNVIGNEAIESIVNSILTWNSLKSIVYSKKCFSSKCVLLLNLLMEHDASTESIDLNNDYFSIISFVTVLNNLDEYTNSNILHFKANISKATELSLDCVQLQKEMKLPYKAVASLKYFSNIIKLNVSGIVIGNDIKDTFISICKTNLQKLQCLCMNNCQLCSTVVAEFTINLQNTSINELQMCNNLIDDEATEALVMAVLHLNSLQIGFKNNKFSDSSLSLLSLLSYKFHHECKYAIKINNDPNVKLMLTILNHISNKKFRQNNCKVCANISQVSVISLSCSLEERIHLSNNASKSFKYFKNLSQLEIHGIVICKQVARTLSMALAKYCTNTLTVLKLNYCQLCSHSALMLLSAKSKSTVTTLKELDFSNNEIRDNAAHMLIKILLQMPELKTINFDRNKFKNQDMCAITDHILKFREMKSLKIRLHKPKQVVAFLTLLSCIKNFSRQVSCQVDNVIRMDKLSIKCIESLVFTKNICLGCAQLRYLRKFQLKGINFTSKAITVLADCLAHFFSKLQKLVLSNCNLDSKSAVKLLSTDKTVIPVSFSSLKIIDFSCNQIEDDALQPLVNSLLQMPKLEKLHFYGNCFTNIIPTLSMLCECKIYAKTLEINYNKIHGSRVCINTFLDVISSIKDNTIERSQHVQSIIKIRHLNLEYYHDDPVVLTENKSVFFKRFISLTELNLSGICILPGAIKNIAYILQHNHGLLTLKLSHCKLASDSIIELFPNNGLPVSLAYRVLKEIDLSSNNIGDEAIVPLTMSLLQMCQLEKLHLDNNKFEEHDINVIFQIILECKKKKPTIRCFSNDYVASFITLLNCANNITSDKMSQQVKSLMNIRNLTLHCTDNLKQCILNVESSFFFNRFTLLQTLDLHGIKIQLQAVTVLAKALKCNSLVALNLSACGLTSESTIKIISTLRKESIRVLCLSRNPIDFNAIKEMCDFVTNNNVITEINMTHDNLTTEGTIMLVKKLVKCKNLKKLKLSNNNITNDATESLLHLIRQLYQYGKFESLQIENNNFSQESIKVIQSSVSWSMWLRYKILT